MRKPVIALSTHIFGNRPLSLDDFKLLKNFGINAIELWFMDPQLYIRDSNEVAKIKGWLDANEMGCASVHAPFWTDLNKPTFRWLSLSSTNPKTREICIDLTKNSIYAAKELGAGIVVIHGIGEREGITLESAEKTFAESLHSLADTFDDCKIELAIENIITPYSRANLIRDFIRRFEHNSVGICVDIGHAFIEDASTNALIQADGYLFEVHIADNLGSEDDHLIPHEGKIDWEPVWQRLKDSPELRVATFEIMPPDISGEGMRKELEKRLEKVNVAIDELTSKLND